VLSVEWRLLSVSLTRTRVMELVDTVHSWTSMSDWMLLTDSVSTKSR
jgi:hypothetical protein